jgi:hypothetical protein
LAARSSAWVAMPMQCAQIRKPWYPRIHDSTVWGCCRGASRPALAQARRRNCLDEWRHDDGPDPVAATTDIPAPPEVHADPDRPD